MRFEKNFGTIGFAGLMRTMFSVLGILIISTVCVPCLRADQDADQTTELLTSGQWTFHGVPRTFNRDGTYSSKSARGTWKIDGNELDISLGRSVIRFQLPLDPDGTQGVSAGGIEQTLARVNPGDEPNAGKTHSPATVRTASTESQQSSARLVQTYRDSLVFVTGTDAAGSGFVTTIGNGTFLVTNAHVAAGVTGAEFRKLDGTVIQGETPSIAKREDIFCMALPPGGAPIPIMSEVDSNAEIGDEVVVLGNAEGEGVINTITGRITGIGPNLVEVDAPFVPGNSGSPIIHLKTGKVIGVATYTITNEYDPITNQKMRRPRIRRFGYRLDSVKAWQAVDWRTFRDQAAQMEKIKALTADLTDLIINIAAHRGRIVGARYTDPSLNGAINDWYESQTGREDRGERLSATENLVSFLKQTCESDIAIAQHQLTYDYFQRELVEQKQTRDVLAKAFDQMLLAVRQ